MKKFFALTLAVAMVLSLASVAFAANSYLKNDDETIPSLFQVSENKLLAYNKDDNPASDNYMATTASFPFGATRYYELIWLEALTAPIAEADFDDADDAYWADDPSVEGFGIKEYSGYEHVNSDINSDGYVKVYKAHRVTDNKTVSGLKVTPKWTEGGEYVKSVEIVKKGGAYFVALTTQGSEIEAEELSGKVYLKGKSGDPKEKIDAYFTVDTMIGFTTGDVLTSGDKSTVVDSSSKKVYDFEDVDADDAEEFTIYFEEDVAEVIVNVKNEEEVLLAVDTKAIDDVDEAYPDANIDYAKLTGKFKKTAEVYLFADEDTYLYEIKNGEPVAMDAEYDEWEEAFVFKTKTLGTYAISDVELEVKAPVETVPANPSTGAAA